MANIVTSWGSSLLQYGTSVVTNWGSYYKLGQTLSLKRVAITKLRQFLLQIVAVSTN